MKRHTSMAAIIAAGWMLVFTTTRTDAASRYVWQESPSPAAPYTNWATAAHVIQEAVDATQAGDTVLVTNGVYDMGGGANASRVALLDPVLLRSINGPTYTTIVGDGMRCVYVGSNATLVGFTLTNGQGGVWCEPSGVVSNCVVTGNSVLAAGGGAYGGTLYDCTLIGNEARGFQFGRGLGGGAYGAMLYHCLITGNSVRGGGGGTAESTLYNCVVTDNSADWWNGHPGGGGGVSASTLHNCTLTYNWTDYGGGAVDSTLYHCSVTGNSAAADGGGVFRSTVYNCIVYYNSADNGANQNWGADVDEWGEAIESLNYSCTTPLPTNGVGNIDFDPRFVNPAAGDFRLLPDSPCIDAGTNLIAFLTTDLDGLRRPLDGNTDGLARFDMGAYEFNPYGLAPTLQPGPDGFQVTVRGEPGKSVRLERSRDLVHWELVDDVPIPAGGHNVISDSAARTAPQLFYRVVSFP